MARSGGAAEPELCLVLVDHQRRVAVAARRLGFGRIVGSFRNTLWLVPNMHVSLE